MDAFRNLLFGTILFSVAACSSGVTQLPEEQARKQLEQGLEAISIFDYNKAYNLLYPVPNSLPEESADWQKATFALASALRYQEPTREDRVRQATELFELASTRGPDAVVQSLSQLELGRIYELSDFPGDTVNMEKAQELYRKVIEEKAAPGLVEEAVLRLANSYSKQFEEPGKVDQALALVREYLAENPDNDQAAVMWQYVALVEDQINQKPQAALDALQKAREKGFAVPSKADNFLWYMVRLAKETGDDKQLVALCQAAISETPRSAHGSLARLELERLQEKHPDWNIEIPERIRPMDIGKKKAAGSEPEEGAATPAGEPAAPAQEDAS